MRSNLSKAALGIVFLASLSACAPRASIKVGEIPPITSPELHITQQTSLAVRGMAYQGQDEVVTSGPELARVNNMVNKLTDALGTARGTWPVYVIDGNDTINAFAVDQNSIVVYTGILRKIDNDDELAAVLGHEIAHILAKHGADEDADTKQTATLVLGRIAGVGAAVGAAFAGVSINAANTLGSVADTATQAVGTGLSKSYDRSQEYEADHVGMMIMAKAGYDPRAAISLWSRTKEIFGETNSFDFLSTHPSDDNRVDSLKEALPEALKYYKK